MNQNKVLKELPTGVHDFRLLREHDFLYVDKTESLFEIASKGFFYFLSRPRRFGKSLFLSTLKELFSGSKELFKGLWIEDKWDWEKKHPVLHFSFAKSEYQKHGLEKALFDVLKDYAAEFQITLSKEDGYKRQFANLIKEIYEKAGKVVILIDEYDKPIIDFLDDKVRAKENREILKEFYIVLKDSQQYLQFVFITGISRFTKVSIFSALNHLDDISMDWRYATLLGYTQQELESNFEHHLENVTKRLQCDVPTLLEGLKKWYNGYSWDGETRVYNPFSILKFLGEQEFKGYWFATGTPEFVADLAREQQFIDMEDFEARLTGFDSYDIENLNVQALLFQTGYLTIKQYDRSRQRYTLGYPNEEVRQAYSEYLLSAFTGLQVSDTSSWAIQLEKSLLNRDIPAAMNLINTVLSNIPNLIFDGKNERYFHSLIHVIFSYFGTYIESEVNTNIGRIDSIIKTPQYIYILEFKMNESAEIALKQIIDKNYAQKYRFLDREIIGVGINFLSEKKGIEGWIDAVL
jgi:Predicted AAA-ATPase/PD-(D/E)XK nuclease superfamily